jgi:hypothetical protein
VQCEIEHPNPSRVLFLFGSNRVFLPTITSFFSRNYRCPIRGSARDHGLIPTVYRWWNFISFGRAVLVVGFRAQLRNGVVKFAAFSWGNVVP